MIAVYKGYFVCAEFSQFLCDFGGALLCTGVDRYSGLDPTSTCEDIADQSVTGTLVGTRGQEPDVAYCDTDG